MRCSPLDPLLLLEPFEDEPGDENIESPDIIVTILSAQFRHIFEVHAVVADNESKWKEDE